MRKKKQTQKLPEKEWLEKESVCVYVLGREGMCGVRSAGVKVCQGDKGPIGQL